MIIYDQDKLHIRDEFTLGQSKNKKLPLRKMLNLLVLACTDKIVVRRMTVKHSVQTHLGQSC